VNLNCKHIYLPDGFKDDVYLSIEDGKIKEISDKPGGSANTLTLDGFVMPGCVNTHAHMGMKIFNELYQSLNKRTQIDGKQGIDWLNQIWGYEPKFTPEDVYAATCMTAYEMISSGTIAVADHYFFPEEVIKTSNETGLRILVSPAIFQTKKNGEYTGNYFMNPDRDIDSLLAEIKDLSITNLGLAKIAIGAHSIYMLPQNDLEKIAKFSEREGIPVHMHLGESQEIKTLKELGTDSISYVNELGLLTERLLIAHGTILTQEDAFRMAFAGSKLAWCPFTNARKGKGLIKYKEMDLAGVPVGLATDGNISAFSMNLFRHMSYGVTLVNCHEGDMSAISTEDSFKILTINGARCLGLDKEIGSIEVGKSADLICVKQPNPTDVIHSTEANDVDFVMVAGRVLKQEGKLTNGDHYQKVRRLFRDSVSRLEEMIKND